MNSVRFVAVFPVLLLVACSDGTLAGEAEATGKPVPEEAGITPSAAPPPTAAGEPASAASSMRTLEHVLFSGDTFESARARLGPDNVVVGELPGAEGETEQGWILFPGDPSRRADVYLDEDGRHPVAIEVRADVMAWQHADGSTGTPLWQRRDGVRIGLGIGELEALNGGPFDFYGFDWDYGGVIVDWRGGKLGPDSPSFASVSLCMPDLPEGEAWPEDYPSGDREFRSDHPALSRVPPAVCAFSVRLRDAPPDET